MDRILINGGVPLKGRSRSAAPRMPPCRSWRPACSPTEPLDLGNVPDLADIASTQRLLQHLGAVGDLRRRRRRAGWCCTARSVLTDTAPYDLVRKMRASVLVLGPLLARTGAARVSLPGGCAIGTRPIDLHLMGLERLGATIELDDGYVHAQRAEGPDRRARSAFRSRRSAPPRT